MKCGNTDTEICPPSTHEFLSSDGSVLIMLLCFLWVLIFFLFSFFFGKSMLNHSSHNHGYHSFFFFWQVRKSNAFYCLTITASSSLWVQQLVDLFCFCASHISLRLTAWHASEALRLLYIYNRCYNHTPGCTCGFSLPTDLASAISEIYETISAEIRVCNYTDFSCCCFLTLKEKIITTAISSNDW